jgi:hypothetical protein
MKLKNIFANFLAVAALAATLTICAAAQTATVESEIEFGMIGGAFGQTARLNLVYRADKDDPSMPPPIQVEFIWHNRQGDVIARSLQTVQPGHGAFSDINFNSLTRANRFELQPCIRILTDPTRRVVVGGSLEIYDNMTGRTSVYADRNLVIEMPPPEMPPPSLTRR